MAQSLSNILIHIIFSTKHRKEFIDTDIQKELHAYICKICNNNKSTIIQIGSMPDHLHMLVSLSRNISVGKLIADIKANSSRWIKTKAPKYHLFAWQTGYGAFSIGQSGAKTCINYIANQAEHHKHFSFDEEFQKLLQKYNVKFDHKYLFAE